MTNGVLNRRPCVSRGRLQGVAGRYLGTAGGQSDRACPSGPKGDGTTPDDTKLERELKEGRLYSDKGLSKMRTKLGQIVELLMEKFLAHNLLDKVLMASPNVRVMGSNPSSS